MEEEQVAGFAPDQGQAGALPPKLRRPELEKVEEEVAWAKILDAVQERDAATAREGCEQFALVRGMTLRNLQEHLIEEKVNLFLIGMETELIPQYTNIDLQGNKDKKYSISCRFSENALRPREREQWPKDRDEILARLDDAGFKGESKVLICLRCDEIGHISKECTMERISEAPKISCYNCGEEGHRSRDCQQPRIDKFACKNCGQSGHKIADCPEEPNPANVECRRCHEMGHFAIDCPNGGSRACRNCGEEGHIAKECDKPFNEANAFCRNCEKTGHRARDCPEPKDWSKVQCNQCQKFGHTVKRCPEAPPPDSSDQPSGGDYQTFNNGGTFEASTYDDSGTGNATAGAEDPWGAPTPAAGGSEW